MLPEIVIFEVRTIIDLIATTRFAEALARCHASRLSAADLGTVIADYGRTPVVSPVDADRLLDVVPVEGAAWPTWSIRAPLWTVEEGRSDLTLELTIIRQPDALRVDLDDLRVL